MSIERKFGISLASVLIATVIIMIFATTITISVNGVMQNANKMSFANEINSIQMSVDSYYIANKEYPVTNENILIDVSTISNIEDFKEENIIEEKIILSKIDYEKINFITLKYGNNSSENDIYAISQDTGKVYYVGGFKVGNNIYFTLTDELKNIITSKNNDEKNMPIIFSKSEEGYTNKEITVTVKVPKTYKDIIVTCKDKVYDYIEKEDYNIYEVKGDENYVVNVNYVDNDGKKNKAEYEVKNFDNNSPTIEVLDNIVLLEEYNEIYGYYNINCNDDLSGIKYIKYEYGKIENNVSDYFKTQGNIVTDNKVMVKRGYEYITLYVEDNASNYDVLYIDI